MRPQEPLDVALGDLFDDLLVDVHTAMPARVVSFDSVLQTCVVQPCLKRKYKDADEASLLPQIEDVPVVFPGSEDLWLVYDLKPDSYVLLVFSERAIADWMVKGGEVDPRRARKHHLSDAIAIPGILPTPAILTSPVESDTIAMRNSLNTANVKVKTAGTVQINEGTGTAVEFARMKTAFDLLKADFNILVAFFNAHVHTGVTTGAGSSGPPAATTTGTTADMTSAESPTVNIP